jgi:hypothetical protein
MLRRVVVVAILVANLLLAQASPPSLCFGFNDGAPPGLPPAAAVSSAGLTVHFTAPVSSSINRLDIWSAIFFTANFQFEIFPTPALGTPPAGVAIGTYAVSSPFGAPGWLSALASAPATLTSGSTYALRITSTGTPQCWTVFYDPLGAQQLPYQSYSAPGCTPSIPSSGQLGLIIRFFGNCPLATSTSLGASCAGLVIGAQVIIVSPSGTIPLGGGQFAQVTNALQLTLGF